MAKFFKRVILVVLDGVGCGELPDASQYGDSGSNTLGHISSAYPRLSLPNLARWGLGHITPMVSVPALPLEQCVASFGKCRELSKGKDTTSGHWEIAGIIVEKPFPTFPNGFPAEVVNQWVKENNLPGILGNVPASGTEILKKCGLEHLETGKPILYTSADSVWQIAAHEEKFGLDRLYAISRSARKICDRLRISRVISRPFVGNTPETFKRTHHRKDFSLNPPRKTMMEFIAEAGLPCVGIGKIWNIYNGRGITRSIETESNTHGLDILQQALEGVPYGLVFVNLIDFDMNFGHRRDVIGFSTALEEFDRFIPVIEKYASHDDLVLLCADHGNDPTYKGTDHTREHIPLIAYRKGARPRDLGVRGSFADIGQTVVHVLTGKDMCLPVGVSFLPEMAL